MTYVVSNDGHEYLEGGEYPTYHLLEFETIGQARAYLIRCHCVGYIDDWTTSRTVGTVTSEDINTAWTGVRHRAYLEHRGHIVRSDLVCYPGGSGYFWIWEAKGKHDYTGNKIHEIGIVDMSEIPGEDLGNDAHYAAAMGVEALDTYLGTLESFLSGSDEPPARSALDLYLAAEAACSD